jgi:hypothetical protein
MIAALAVWSKIGLDRESKVAFPAATRFVADSALEGDGFELPVPREKGFDLEHGER